MNGNSTLWRVTLEPRPLCVPPNFNFEFLIYRLELYFWLASSTIYTRGGKSAQKPWRNRAQECLFRVLCEKLPLEVTLQGLRLNFLWKSTKISIRAWNTKPHGTRTNDFLVGSHPFYHWVTLWVLLVQKFHKKGYLTMWNPYFISLSTPLSSLSIPE